ncbi:uncharacterized protein LOC127881406 [Dreissena polymorpha]|uniref:uncharacterized protein LOC127881406 n=1 Tax=Dreissena polymorpha TaxID=45954 RepID=UPI002264E4EC|nr:uncharacterized protein LOC127881406 [Dreissena polymorpha]
MAEVFVKNNNNRSPFVDNEEEDMGHSDVSNNTVSGKQKKRRSKVDLLEERFDEKYGKLENTLHNIVALLQCQSQRHGNSTQGNGKSPNYDQGSDTSPNFEERTGQSSTSNRQDDVLSIHPASSEHFSLSDSEEEDTEHSASVRRCLKDIFGEDACLKKDAQKPTGICLENSQKEILEQSYRSKTPNNVTAFSEECKDLFPVDEDTEHFLRVPTLDDIVDTCLTKKFGSRASFAKHGTFLFSQPNKMVEKTAYRGQQSVYMGIVTQMYMQQALAMLMDMVTDKPDIEKKVKDIFALSTRSLDQFGRAGAFFHIIRRQVTMSETSLYELDDSRTISNLPLRGDGVFGEELEKTLKQKKDKRKTLEELLPEKLQKKETYKRKASEQTEQQTSVKRQYVKTNTRMGVQPNEYNRAPPTFRIPKYNADSRSTFRTEHRAGGSRGRGNYAANNRPRATVAKMPSSNHRLSQ